METATTWKESEAATIGNGKTGAIIIVANCSCPVDILQLFVPSIARTKSPWAALVPQGDNLAKDLGFQTGIPSNYSVGDIEWRGFEDFDEDQVFTGTIEVTLILIPASLLNWRSNNAVQDVINQMRQIKGAHYTPGFVSRAENHTLEAEHDDYHTRRRIYCGGMPADVTAVDEGISYLNHLPDSTRCSNSPSSCGRISCSYSSAIYWCNDNKECYQKWLVGGKISDDNLELTVHVLGQRC
ncbi:hypothetical protein CIB48_g1785 [Xylaria polymorpha]|nr:hypothetical protein CIB48_g1785 [Xylaria polymorpha]